MVITTYYINNNMKFKTSFINFYYIISFYFGEIIIKQVIEIIKKYKFEEKLGYFILDNIINNNLYIKIIFCEI